MKGLLSSFKEPSSQKEKEKERERERKRERWKEKGEWGSPKQPVKKINHGQSDSQIAGLKWGSSQAQRAIKSRKKK